LGLRTNQGQTLTIIGVAPAGFSGVVVGQRPQVFVPLTLRRAGSGIHKFPAFRNRRRCGCGGEHGSTRNPPRRSAAQARVTTGRKRPEFDSRRHGASSCAVARNYGARARDRLRELVAQLAAELIVLGALGGALAVPVAAGTLAIIEAILPAEFAEGLVIRLDLAATLFAAIVTLATVALFGLMPAFQASRADPGHVLKSHSAQSSGGRSMARLRAVLATAQITLSMVLLVLAGLFTQSLVNIARVDLGMTVDSLPGVTGVASMARIPCGRWAPRTATSQWFNST
jgi:hypothetical protein